MMFRKQNKEEDALYITKNIKRSKVPSPVGFLIQKIKLYLYAPTARFLRGNSIYERFFFAKRASPHSYGVDRFDPLPEYGFR